MEINFLKINHGAIAVCHKLQLAQYKSYIVGGCVRDLLLDYEPKDWDICTDATPETVQSLFSKTYPTGLQHGTITVAINEEHFEVTTFRVEGEYLDGRRPASVEFVFNVEDDLARRDLTINAIAYDPINKVLVDPFNGAIDLKNEIIRCVGNPLDRFSEDGLRIMRVARFASRFNYKVEDFTKNGMKSSLETLQKVSIERIKDELWKTLKTNRPSIGLKLLRECHILSMIELEWDNAKIKNVIEEIDSIPSADVETKFAVLCSWFSNKAIEKLALHLKLSNIELKKILFIINAMREYHTFSKQESAHSARKFLAYMRNNAPEHHAHSLQEFLLFSDALEINARNTLEKYQGETVWGRTDLKINGNDLLTMGIPAGPSIKKLLAEAYNLILEFPERNEREMLLDGLKKIVEVTLLTKTR